MATAPDQLVAPVQPDGADKLDSDTEELADGLASKMAAPAANAEAAAETAEAAKSLLTTDRRAFRYIPPENSQTGIPLYPC